jgi:hypothetical protein
VTTAPLITRTLQYALTPAVRTQDVAKLLVNVAKQGGLGFNLTWQFIIDRSDDILKKYGGEWGGCCVWNFPMSSQCVCCIVLVLRRMNSNL